MKKIDQAYNYLNGDNVDIYKAESLYLEIYNDCSSLLKDKIEAAVQLGYIYAGDFDEPENNQVLKDLDKAISFMRFADEHYEDSATEWLAEYYKDKAFVEFFGYSLDLPNYLEKNSSFIIDRLDKYYQLFDFNYFKDIMELIGYLERWWKRIKDENSKVKRALSKKRNQCIEDLSSLLKKHAFDEQVSKEIKSFLVNYYAKFKCIKDAFLYCDYVQNKEKIDSMESLDELEEVRRQINDIEDSLIRGNLNNCIARKKLKLLIEKDEMTDDELNLVKHLLKDKGIYSDFLKSTIHFAFENAILNKDYKKADYLCTKFNDCLPIRFDYFDKSKNEAVETNALQKQQSYERIRNYYLDTHSQTAFHELFNLLWEKRKFDEVANLMMDAQKHHISFEFIKKRYNDFLLKNVIWRLPVDFFADDIKKIKEEINKRGIKRLVHFSSIDNVPSILENGLLSIEELKKRNIGYARNDEIRKDGFYDYICLSITNENSSMIWNKYFSGNTIDKGIEIFEIKPSILYEHPECVVYCSCNASKRNAYKHRDYGFKGFISMFENDDSSINNSDTPTDPQAEVLFLKNISKDEYIFNHYFKKYHLW